jgi:hypothetical protein
VSRPIKQRQRRPDEAHSAEVIRGANDNPAPGEACITDVGAALPSPSLTSDELEILRPLIGALARMAARRV